MPELDRHQMGQRYKRAGEQWRQDCADWLQDNGWPGAGTQTRNRRSDLTGTWDLAVECTIIGWDKIWMKLEQSARDAKERGLTDFCVWKKRNGRASPAMGAVMMPAHRFFPLVQRLEKLERDAVDADDQFTRGWLAHEKHVRQQAEEAV